MSLQVSPTCLWASTEVPQDLNLLWVVVAGGYRTGSTLQYNLLGSYLELTHQGHRVGYGATHQVYKPHTGIGLVKSHELGGWEKPILRGEAKAVTTYRDEKGKIQSMMQKFGYQTEAELMKSLTWLEDKLNERLWWSVGTFSQYYGSLTSNPLYQLEELVNELHLGWNPVAAEQAVTMSSTEEAKRVVQTLAPGEFDPTTLLHWNHV